jgi:DNA-binding IclR family transcriptional regulator
MDVQQTPSADYCDGWWSGLAMTNQAAKVLAYFTKWGSDTDSNIATMTGIPRASVRRSIQELIHEGNNITYAGPTGLYTLVREEVHMEQGYDTASAYDIMIGRRTPNAF